MEDAERANAKAHLQAEPCLSIQNAPAAYQGDKWTRTLILAAVVSAFGYAVPAGYSLGVLNTPVKILQQWCNETIIESRGASLSKEQFDLMWSLIVSVFLIGGVIGGLTGAWFADRVGRKGTLLFGNILNLVSGLLFLFSKFVSSVEMFFVGRIVVGFIAGLMTTVVPMYVTELSPPKYSGFMGVLFPAGLTFGILIAQILGLNWILGTERLWPYLVSGYATMSILVFASVPWLPESPKYLFQVLRLEDKAIEELSKVRGLPSSVVSWELTNASATSTSSNRRSNQEKWNLLRVLTTPRLRLPLALVVALQAGQQFAGINAIFNYSTNIFETAGLNRESIPYANIGTGLINFLVSAGGLLVVNSFGRRPLLIWSCLLSSVTLILLTISSRYMDYASWVPIMSVVLVLFFIFVYDIGLGPIPYFIGAELVDIGPRPVVMALGSVANWGGNFIITASYTFLHNWLRETVFLLFSGWIMLLMVFVTSYLPETKTTTTRHTHRIVSEE